MEARGFTWEPAETDLYVKGGGDLVVVRARGARRRLHGEPLNAKRVLEALAGGLLPAPAGCGTPEACPAPPAAVQLQHGRDSHHPGRPGRHRARRGHRGLEERGLAGRALRPWPPSPSQRGRHRGRPGGSRWRAVCRHGRLRRRVLVDPRRSGLRHRLAGHEGSARRLRALGRRDRTGVHHRHGPRDPRGARRGRRRPDRLRRRHPSRDDDRGRAGLRAQAHRRLGRRQPGLLGLGRGLGAAARRTTGGSTRRWRAEA